MKNEISDLNKNKYELALLRIHKKIKKEILYKMNIKNYIYNSFKINFLFIVLNSIHTIILCNDFIINYNNSNLNYSKWIRFFTLYYLVEKLKISNETYLTICIILILIFLLKYIYFYYLSFITRNLNPRKIYKIKIPIIVVILNHFSYLFFSFINEYFSFIFYIVFYPNKFIIKKKCSTLINNIFLWINLAFILVFNYTNYRFIELVNIPNSDLSYSFQMNFSTFKLIVLIFLRNLSLIHAFPLYLSNNLIKSWDLIFNISMIILFVLVYISSVKLFNYDNLLNNILSFIGEFCFISLIIELVIYLLAPKNIYYKSIVFSFFIKLLIAKCLNYFLNIIYEKIMIKKIKKELFLNSVTYSKKLINIFLYLEDIINKKNKLFVKIIKYLYNHQQFCINKNCGCKIIKIVSSNENDIIKNKDYFYQQVYYFLETILIKFNFISNFDIAFLLSEHYFLNKKNAIIAYSLLQTVLHNNYNNLSDRQLLIIYETLAKYINYTLKEKNIKSNKDLLNGDSKALSKTSREKELGNLIAPLIKHQKILKLMINYSGIFNEIIQNKQNYENYVIVKVNETNGEVENISSEIFTNSFIYYMIKTLKIGNKQTLEIKKNLLELKEYKSFLSYEFLYKTFLFIDYFWNSLIPNELLDILFAFTANRNLYINKVNNNIYDILEQKYNEQYINEKKNYFLLLKYTKGIKISYLSETLLRKLNLENKNLKNNDIDILLINDFIIPHSNAINQYFMIKQNLTISGKKIHLFDKKKYMIESKMDSIFQFGINKNIIINCIINIKEKSNKIKFLANKNFEIISITHSFENKFNLSLDLINEFKIEIKNLFDISLENIHQKYEKELKRINKIRQFLHLDPKEYLVKNIFKQKKIKDSFLYIQNEYSDGFYEDNDNKTVEKNKFKQKQKNPLNRIIQKIFNNQNYELLNKKSINFQINTESINSNMIKIIENLEAYEHEKFENKDYLRLINNYHNIFSNNDDTFIKLNFKIIFLYDTNFYLCKIEQYENNFLIKDPLALSPNFYKKESIIDNLIYCNDEKSKDITLENISKRKNVTSNKNNFYKIHIKKIERNKISKKILGSILISIIFLFLILYIIILFTQIKFISQNDKIFKNLYYNYFQKTKLLYIHSALLNIHYNLLNINNNISNVASNKEILFKLYNNLQESFHLFYKYYLDYKSSIGGDEEEIYRPREFNQITINWENQRFYNSYMKEMQVLLHRLYFCTNSEEISEGTIEDCENLLLENFNKPNFDKKSVETHGNLIVLIYYLTYNYDSSLKTFFEELSLSLKEYFTNYSNKIIIYNLVLEIIALILYIIFFIIIYIFLSKSNKYIFHNILCLFLDFTQNNTYDFNNKIYNLLINKNIRNYISLLKGFTPKKLDILKNEIYNIDFKDEINNELENKTNISENQNNTNDSKLNNSIQKQKKNRAKKGSFSPGKSSFKFSPLIKLNLINEFNPNEKNISITPLKKTSIQKLNFSTLFYSINNNNLENNEHHSNKSIKKDITLTNNNANNSSIVGLKENNSSFNTINLNNEIKISEKDNNDNIYGLDIKLTIEKIIFFSEIILIKTIRYLMTIFIVASLIFIIYYIMKIIFCFIVIKKLRNLYGDFEILCLQYYDMIFYWNKIKTLFILPNIKIEVNLNETEIYFNKLNNDVYNLVSNRIYNYKRTSKFYDILFNLKSSNDLLKDDFCKGYKRCYNIINSTQNILLNGLNPAFSLYAKEAETYYRDLLNFKDKIKNKEDIKRYLIKEKYNQLNANLIHVISFINQKFFELFLIDEKELIKIFYIRTIYLNLISFTYCILLNIFTMFFVFNYLNKVIDFIETSTSRIICSICNFKLKIKEKTNFE